MGGSLPSGVVKAHMDAGTSRSCSCIASQAATHLDLIAHPPGGCPRFPTIPGSQLSSGNCRIDICVCVILLYDLNIGIGVRKTYIYNNNKQKTISKYLVICDGKLAFLCDMSGLEYAN